MPKPVSEAAVAKRLSRFLQKTEGILFKKCRETSRDYAYLGPWYAVDSDRNFLVRCHVDIEAEARDVGVLKSWEDVVAGDHC